jgi:hypothetical protein
MYGVRCKVSSCSIGFIVYSLVLVLGNGVWGFRVCLGFRG